MRRGTKLQRHLAHFRETKQMTPWLARRLEWDEETSAQIFAELYPLEHKKQLQELFLGQFDKQSLLYKRFMGMPE